MNSNGATLEDVLKAVRRKCLDCCGNEVEEINGCPVEECPLYPYRPHYKERTPKPRGLRKRKKRRQPVKA